MISPRHIKSCWLVFDAEKKGIENQCLGLAEALGISKIISKPIPKAPFLRFLPRLLWLPFLRFQKGLLKEIKQEKPDLIISSGTRGSVVGAFIKKKIKSPFLINILNPRLFHGLFDVIIAPEHDRLSYPNVLSVLGGLHRVTSERLEQEVADFPFSTKNLKGPVVAVLLGGPTKGFSLTKESFVTLGSQISHLHRARYAHFLVSFSRRTPEDFKNAFLRASKGVSMEIYDPLSSKTPNPYFAYLGLADHIIVTADSISMLIEACSTGKPVYSPKIQKMPKKFHVFHDSLEKKGAIRPFLGSLGKEKGTSLEGEMARVVKKIREFIECS